MIVIKFVKGEDNTAVSFTKNTSRATFAKHLRRFVCDESREYLEVNEELLIEMYGSRRPHNQGGVLERMNKHRVDWCWNVHP